MVVISQKHEQNLNPNFKLPILPNAMIYHLYCESWKLLLSVLFVYFYYELNTSVVTDVIKDFNLLVVAGFGDSPSNVLYLLSVVYVTTLWVYIMVFAICTRL